MNLHEYQGKQLFAKFGLPVSKNKVITSAEDAINACRDIGGTKWVIKAQVHAGGRGKAGGVKLINTPEEAVDFSNHWLGKRLVTYQTDAQGQLVNSILIEECTDIAQELYLSAVVDRGTQRIVFIGSSEGGVNIEEVAEKTPEKIIYEPIDPLTGPMPFQARKIAFNLGLSGKAFKEMTKFVVSLYNAYDKSDSSLFEINPVLKTSDDRILAVDAKVSLDDNALFRHKDYLALRDIREENAIEVEAGEVGLNYVDLDGNVGCMVNGAGLAMATMDLIKQAGGDLSLIHI